MNGSVVKIGIAGARNGTPWATKAPTANRAFSIVQTPGTYPMGTYVLLHLRIYSIYTYLLESIRRVLKKALKLVARKAAAAARTTPVHTMAL
jgi:hypothetical protein